MLELDVAPSAQASPYGLCHASLDLNLYLAQVQGRGAIFGQHEAIHSSMAHSATSPSDTA